MMRCTAFHVFVGKQLAAARVDIVVNGHSDEAMRYRAPLLKSRCSSSAIPSAAEFMRWHAMRSPRLPA
eukprot:2522811-Rhodomonas_salina.1